MLVLHVSEQDGLPEIEDLLSHQIHDILNCDRIQSSQVWYVVNKLLPLHHILVVVTNHVVLETIIQLGELRANKIDVLPRQGHEEASVLVLNAASTFHVCQDADLAEDVSGSEHVYCFLLCFSDREVINW